MPFTLFIIFQLFNAFNSRELGFDGVLKNLNKNKIMAAMYKGAQKYIKSEPDKEKNTSAE